jgi:hypothetical protein
VIDEEKVVGRTGFQQELADRHPPASVEVHRPRVLDLPACGSQEAVDVGSCRCFRCRDQGVFRLLVDCN